MFQNIGRKIKILAIVVCWIGIIASIVFAIAFWQEQETLRYDLRVGRGPGFVILILGSLLSYVSSWLLYAFGELVQTSCDRTELAREAAEAQAETNRLLHLLLENRKGANAPALTTRPLPSCKRQGVATTFLELHFQQNEAPEKGR